MYTTKLTKRVRKIQPVDALQDKIWRRDPLTEHDTYVTHVNLSSNDRVTYSNSTHNRV